MTMFYTAPDIAHASGHPEWRIRWIVMRDRIEPAACTARYSLFSDEQMFEIIDIADDIAAKIQARQAPQDAA